MTEREWRWIEDEISELYLEALRAIGDTPLTVISLEGITWTYAPRLFVPRLCVPHLSAHTGAWKDQRDYFCPHAWAYHDRRVDPARLAAIQRALDAKTHDEKRWP